MFLHSNWYTPLQIFAGSPFPNCTKQNLLYFIAVCDLHTDHHMKSSLVVQSAKLFKSNIYCDSGYQHFGAYPFVLPGYYLGSVRTAHLHLVDNWIVSLPSRFSVVLFFWPSIALINHLACRMLGCDHKRFNPIITSHNLWLLFRSHSSLFLTILFTNRLALVPTPFNIYLTSFSSFLLFRRILSWLYNSVFKRCQRRITWIKKLLFTLL